MMVSRRLIIKGRVQGVWYRASAQKKAIELDLAGYAMNRSDGGVYLEVEGHDDLVEKFIDWCRQGPSQARVDEVIIEPQDIRGFESFDVRR